MLKKHFLLSMLKTVFLVNIVVEQKNQFHAFFLKKKKSWTQIKMIGDNHKNQYNFNMENSHVPDAFTNKICSLLLDTMRCKITVACIHQIAFIKCFLHINNIKICTTTIILPH